MAQQQAGMVGQAGVVLPTGRRPSLPGWLWEHHRSKILELYLIDEHTLSEVAEIMRRQEGFDATEQMYKKRLSSWGISKYHKYTDSQKLYMIRKVLRRVLEDKPATSFRRDDNDLSREEAKNLKRVLQRGLKDVDPDLIERFNQIQLEKHSESGVVRHASTCSSHAGYGGGVSRNSSTGSNGGRERGIVPKCMLKRFDSTSSRNSVIAYTPVTASRRVSLRVPGGVRYSSRASSASREENGVVVEETVETEVLVEMPPLPPLSPMPEEEVLSVPPRPTLPTIQSSSPPPSSSPHPLSHYPSPSPQSPQANPSDSDLLFLPELDHERNIEYQLSQRYPSSRLTVILSRVEDRTWGRTWASINILCADCESTLRKTIPVIDTDSDLISLSPDGVSTCIQEVYDEHVCLPWHEENVRIRQGLEGGIMSPVPAPYYSCFSQLEEVAEEAEPPEQFVSAALISPPLPMPSKPWNRSHRNTPSSSTVSSNTSSRYELDDTPPTTAENTYPMPTPEFNDNRFSWQPALPLREVNVNVGNVTVATLRDLAEASRALERNGGGEVGLKRPGTAGSEMSESGSVRSVRRQRKVDCFGPVVEKGHKKQRRVY